MKNVEFNGNRYLDLPACSIVPQSKHTFEVFQKRVLRRIFEPKTVQVAGGWRKLRNEEFQISCALRQTQLE
jgi:hypothetical protein